MRNVTLKAAQLLVFFTMNALTLTAQKLPGVQENPIAIPANVKVDGFLDEWNNKLQAYKKIQISIIRLPMISKTFTWQFRRAIWRS